MNNKAWIAYLLAALLLALLLMSAWRRPASLAAPPADVQSQSFGVTATSVLTATGASGGYTSVRALHRSSFARILASAFASIFNSGAPNEIAGLSWHGFHGEHTAAHPVLGRPQPRRRQLQCAEECSPAQAHAADVFESA